MIKKKYLIKHKALLIAGMCILILLLAAFLLYSLSNSRSFQLFGDLVSSVPTDRKVVALTFDDGPTENTGEILKTLDELAIKATFFLCGADIASRPKDGAAITLAGHGIGNHTYSHQRMWFVSYDFCREEVEKTDELILSTGFSGTIYFRPPYFKRLFMLPLYLKNNNRTTILADVEPESVLGMKASSEDIARYALDHVKNGSIILLHAMHHPDTVLPAVRQIAEEMKNRGYTFLTVEELMQYR